MIRILFKDDNNVFALIGFVFIVLLLILSISVGPWPWILVWLFFLCLVLAYFYNEFRPGGLTTIRIAMLREGEKLERGQAPQIIDELERDRAGGKSSLISTLKLVIAYNFAGRGDQAEPLAREMLDQIHTDGTVHKKDKKLRFLTDMTYLTLVDAVCVQGRFQEAAQILEPRLDKSLSPVFIRTIQAWFYMLAGDIAQMPALLDKISPLALEVTSKFKFMLAYMRYKALDEDPHAGLRKYGAELSKWDTDAERSSDTPYGKRLRAILDEIHTLIDT